MELLVVLVIVGLVATLLPSFSLRDGSSQMLDRTAGLMANGLREVRAMAIQENRDALFLLDVDRRVFRAGAATAPVRIEGDMEIGMVAARREQISETAGRIRFFSDGSSTGGRLTLAAGAERRDVDVDWLTGSISVDRHGE